MTREEAQAAMAVATAERDAVQANLLDLDNCFGKRLLAGAQLRGESQRQWESASAGLVRLWDTFSAYSAVVDKAAEILGTTGRLHPSRLAEAIDLMRGPSVVLASPVSPLSQRSLTAGSQRRLTPAQAVAEMQHEFPAVAQILTAAETVWNDTADGLSSVGTELQQARSQAEGLADLALADEIAQADEQLTRLRDALNSDPLSLWSRGHVDTTQLGQLREQAAAVTARCGELASVRADADQRISEAQAAVGAARQAWQDAMTARERAAGRILVNAMGDLPDISGLESRLSGLAGLRDAGRWTRLASELDQVAALTAAATAQCRDAEQAAAGLIGRRDELRGLLDAYRAKAAKLGSVERLDSRYRDARDLLWTAPCDLSAAAAAVTAYQQAVLALSGSGK